MSVHSKDATANYWCEFISSIFMSTIILNLASCLSLVKEFGHSGLT